VSPGVSLRANVHAVLAFDSFARHHDFAGYFQQELEFGNVRFSAVSNTRSRITVLPSRSARQFFFRETLARRLKEALPEEFDLGAPAPAPLANLPGHYRSTSCCAGRRSCVSAA